MQRGRLGATAILLVVVLGGCTQVVPGVPVPMIAEPAPLSTAGPPATPAGPAAPRSGLDADVLADECLLNASELGSLVGEAVRPPEQSTVTRSDGTTGSSCLATSGGEPRALINVYRVRSGTPADFVRAASAGRELAGAGEAAVVIDTDAGPTLQLASPAYVVTILVAGRVPADDAWRAASAAALSRLPSS